MKECPNCYKKHDDTWMVCMICSVSLRPVSSTEPDELSIEYLTAALGRDFKGLFLPPDDFYEFWNTSDERLGRMAGEILKWLHIDQHPLPVKYSKGMKDIPGVYVFDGNETGIFINDKYKNEPFQVGAILAHECMHHYMRIHKLEAAEIKKNELKTDLSTIGAGLGILIINGMSHKSHWYLTIIMLFLGRLYINERMRSFGYFSPTDYCERFSVYLKLKYIDSSGVIGFIHPEARSFLPREIACKKPTAQSSTIRFFEKNHKRSFIVQIVLVLIGVSAISAVYYAAFRESEQERLQISSELQTMKQQILDVENKIKQAEPDLERMKKEMEAFELSGDTAGYGKVLIPYEDLKKESENNYERYQRLVKLYNSKVYSLKNKRRV